jgi:hypothetical protein
LSGCMAASSVPGRCLHDSLLRPTDWFRLHKSTLKLVFSTEKRGSSETQRSPKNASTLRFTGAMIGLCAQDVGGTFKHADFDYFEARLSPKPPSS